MSLAARVIMTEAAAVSDAGGVLSREAGRRAAEIVVVDANGSLAAAARHARDAGCTRIVAAGGDGTVSRLVAGLAPDLDDVELAIVPLGTGNDLARSLGLEVNGDPDPIMLAFEGPSRPIDVGRYRSTDGSRNGVFVNAVSAGFGGEVTERIAPEHKELWGALAYWLVGAAQLADAQEFQMHLEIDDDSLTLDGHGLAAANGRFIAGGMPIAPRARLDDGLLELSIAPVQGMLGRLAAAVDISFGRHEQSEHVLTRRARRFAMRAEPTMLVSVDGDVVGRFDVEMTMLSRRLHVVAARTADAFADTA